MEKEHLYLNGMFHTMDHEIPIAEALLVREERILAVGRRSDVQAAAHAGAEKVDLGGSTVIPGFNDSHAHVLWLGMALEQVDVGAVATVGDITHAIQTRARRTKGEQWVEGRGYDQNMLVEQRHPTRFDLDPVSHGHPVVLRHTSGHVLTCNSLALQAAGVNADTPDPAGGIIERNEHGEPTGVMKESAMDLIVDVVPPPTVEEGAVAIRRALETMATYGITSVSDAATGTGPSIEPALAMYERAAAIGQLAGRVQLMPQIHYVAPPDGDSSVNPDHFPLGTHPLWLTIGPVKIFSDGALSTRTAALREPYAGDGADRGILLWPDEILASMIGRAHAAGWQIATHALGDRAVAAVVEAYQRALQAHPRADHRHRIEHCMLLDDSLAARIRDLGIVPSLQPDIFRLGDGYVSALGKKRASTSIPIGTFRQLGVRIALSSDAPVIPCDPLPIIRSAIERRTPSGVHLGSDEASTVAEAIHCYTVGGAFATRTDSLKGMLRPGMLADFTVLSRDPITVPTEEFDSLKVTMTVVGGRQSYSA